MSLVGAWAGVRTIHSLMGAWACGAGMPITTVAKEHSPLFHLMQAGNNEGSAADLGESALGRVRFGPRDG